MSTAVLAARCAEQTRRFQNRLPSGEEDCFALFHRALVEREEQAWEALYSCYEGMMRGWAGQVAGDGEDVAPLVAAAFERLWLAVDAAKFGRFPDLRSLLQYIKMCVRAAAIDARRAQARQALLISLDASRVEEGRTEPVAADDVVGQTLSAAARREFWEVVQRHLVDSQEVVLVRLCFVEGLPPREVCRRAPADFSRPEDVYRVKRNVLDRLRRSAEVQELARGQALAGE